MNVPRAIEQDVERAYFKGKRIDSIRIRDVENTNLDAELLGFECIKSNLVDVRSPYRAAPALAKLRAAARPIPCPAAVMRAVLPSRIPDIVSLLRSLIREPLCFRLSAISHS